MSTTLNEKFIKSMDKKLNRVNKYRNDFHPEYFNLTNNCKICNKDKPLYLFPSVKNKKESVCRKCKSSKIVEHYNKNERSYRRTKTELKKEKKCIECGCDNINYLEFDHIKREGKDFTIGKSFGSKNIVKEVEKTQILCIWCHRLKTYKEIVENHKIFKYDDNETVTDGIQCYGPLCDGLFRHTNNFYIRKNRNNKIMQPCKICHAYNSQQNRRLKQKYVIDEKIKIGNCQNDGCDIKVNENNHVCFDFDHLDQQTKSNTISRMVQNYTLDKIKVELEKCQLLCCYCHFDKTRDQLNFKPIIIS